VIDESFKCDPKSFFRYENVKKNVDMNLWADPRQALGKYMIYLEFDISMVFFENRSSLVKNGCQIDCLLLE
jgi:hypothetical protein